MTRQEKYPETKTFHYYNANPHNRKSGDCVIRAICTALNQSWEQTARDLTEVGIKYGYTANDKHTYEKYLASKGWVKHSQPKKADNTKYTGKEFCNIAKTSHPYIAHIGSHHIVAIINGKVNDIWDSTDGVLEIIGHL